MELPVTGIGEIILLIIFCVSMLLQLYYYLAVFSKLAFLNQEAATGNSEPVTVIVCARNELKNLRQNLPAIMEQDYTDFQVVVVNDCSWDESEKFLEEMQEKYSHLKVVTIAEQEKYRHGKKFALSLGIKAAKHDILLLTDADCQPASRSWIQKMVSRYKPGTDIIIGYGAYMKLPGLLNKMIRMDTVFNAIQFLSFAVNKHPYMGVGRNLSYRKALFFSNKGFANHNHIMSGDDDLFVNETATVKNTAVELSRDSFTYSSPRSSFKSWLQQKKRHMSTGSYYKGADKARIGFFFFSLIFFYISILLLAIAGIPWQLILCAWFIRLLLQMIIFGNCMKKLGEADLLWMVPFFELAVVFLYPTLTVSNVLFKDKTWK
jgi:poly-beta-1,6-N-acetyl-D-glucosamine synthase